MVTKTTLIIVPHLDDETISCGGLIWSRRAAGQRVIVLPICTRAYDYGRKDGWKEEYQDFVQAKRVLDFETHLPPKIEKEGEPGAVGFYRPLETIETVLASYKPTEVVIPAADDLNQDHQHLNHVCRIALRPVNLGHVTRVLEFLAIDGIARQPTYFVPMTHVAMEQKLSALRCYTQEVRSTGPRAAVNLISQARVWGGMIDCEYAEGFRTVIQREWS